MNLFWKKIFGRLMSTDKFDRLEADFMTASEKLATLRNSPLIVEYKKLNLEAKLSSSGVKKQTEKRLNELRKDPDVDFYRKQLLSGKHRYGDVFLTFQDDFHWSYPKDSQWQTGFYFSNENLIRDYSFCNEKQANYGDRNLSSGDGKLCIHTRRQNARAIAWHQVNGFMEKDFPFTSGIIQTAESFRQKGGIFKAKIRCSGHIHHAFWLGTEGKQPHINIFHFDGKNIRMNYMNHDSGDGTIITGIDPSEFYIYTLQWTQEELIWSVNNIEVFRASSDIPWENMFPVFNSFIPEQIPGEEGKLEVSLIRIYQFNP